MKKNTISKHSSGIDWNKVDTIPEELYDYEEAPEATLEFFKTAKIRMPEKTIPVAIRLKSSTVEFFKHKSRHYQSMINSVLDVYVQAHSHDK